MPRFATLGGFNLFRTLKTVAKDAVKVGPVAFIPGAGAAVVLAVGVAAAGHTHAPIVRDVSRAVNKLAQNKYVHAIVQGYTSGYMQANPLYFAKTLVMHAADETLHGVRLDRAILDQRKAVAGWLGDKAKYASQAAGVPPSVTPVLTAASNIAAGQPIPQNIMAVASGVLGQTVGPVATDALQKGAAYAQQLAGGATPALLAAVANARKALPAGAAQHAFDSGLVLRLGQHLQQKGFAAAHELLPGKSVPGKVLTALKAPTHDLLAAATQHVQQQLGPGAADQTHRVVAHIVQMPILAKLNSHDLAAHEHVPEPVARAALASISHEVPGAPIVHPQRLAALVGRPSPPTSKVGPAAALAASYIRKATS